MKRIRILTGVHAGVSVPLAPGRTVIGADEHADVFVSDWDDEALTLLVDEQEQAHRVGPTAQPINPHQGQAADGSVHPGPAPEPLVPLKDFVARRHGSIVLCVGPDSPSWPTDVELLDELYGRGNTQERGYGWQMPVLVGVGVLACGAAIMCAVLLGSGTGLASSPSADTPRPDILAEHLRRDLAKAGLTDLAVTVRGETLQISGYVPNGAADAFVRDIAAREGRRRVALRYRVASSDAQTIAQLIATPGVRVAYAGSGVFALTGTVSAMPDFDAALARARKELDGDVARIDSSVTGGGSTASVPPYTSLIAAGAVRYIRTPDGVKHLFPEAATPGTATAVTEDPLPVQVLSAAPRQPRAADAIAGAATSARGTPAAWDTDGGAAPSMPANGIVPRSRARDNTATRPPLPPPGMFPPLPPLPASAAASRP